MQVRNRGSLHVVSRAAPDSPCGGSWEVTLHVPAADTALLVTSAGRAAGSWFDQRWRDIHYLPGAGSSPKPLISLPYEAC